MKKSEENSDILELLEQMDRQDIECVECYLLGFRNGIENARNYQKDKKTEKEPA